MYPMVENLDAYFELFLISGFSYCPGPGLSFWGSIVIDLLRILVLGLIEKEGDFVRYLFSFL